MAITISLLTVDKDYADGDILEEDNLDQALIALDDNSIANYINTYVVPNLLQFTRDAYPDGIYTYTDDGVKSSWNNNTLFDKQVATDSYSGGDIDIETSTDADWEDVDTVNASIAITPDAIGNYRVTFRFMHRTVFTATTLGQIFTRFRLTDGTNASKIVASNILMPAPGAGSCEFNFPITIDYVIDFAATTGQTVKLQKRNDTTTAVTTNVVCASEANGEIEMIVEKI